MRNTLLAAVMALLLTQPGVLRAALVPYVDSASFYSDVAGYDLSVLDFDDQTAGTTIASGATLDGITFSYDFGGVQIKISDAFDTTSSPNFLGTDDGDLFQDGDRLDLSFDPVSAIGIYIITADVLLDDDIGLSVGATTAFLDADNLEQTLTDGSSVYFLGLFDDTNTFSAASIVADSGEIDPSFLFNLDDITLAADSAPSGVLPAPATLLLVATGLAAIPRRGRRAIMGSGGAKPRN